MTQWDQSDWMAFVIIVGAVLWVASMAIDKSDRCHTYHDYRYCDLDELPMPGLGK